MNPAIIVVVILIVAALLIWACKEKKLGWIIGDTCAAPSASYLSSGMNGNGYGNGSTILVTPPVPAAYPMYDVNYRYPFGVPWDIDIERLRRRPWGKWRR